MAPIRYYHVMNKDGEWRLYFGNSPAPILSDADRAAVVKAARTLARQSGMKVIIHKKAEQDGAPDGAGTREDSPGENGDA